MDAQAINDNYDPNAAPPWESYDPGAGGNYQSAESSDDPWDFLLPSVNQEKEASKNAFVDNVDDGSYTLAIVGMSPQLGNRFKKKDGSPGKPRRAITFRIVKSDEPEDVGLDFQQFYTESMHPKSALYPLVRAAMGGSLDPNYTPTLRDLKDAQVRGTLTTGPSENDPSQEVQRLVGLLPVKTKLPVPERRKSQP